ncbi:BnaC07g20920D [Brassica napus]|uniref:BnaC07g20920D protein n=1 Tax=Brassica napus TaxID=3708 RepID=A0A078HHC5_BRANA|nr:BnaC07g20920D [Brassica napus]
MADSDIETSSNHNSNHSTASTTSVHISALDGIVNANSLFTVAVFVGITFDQPRDLNLADKTECNAGRDVERDLVVFEVISFAFFLFSSLVAQGLKLTINLLNSKETDEPVDPSWAVCSFCCQWLNVYIFTVFYSFRK